MLARVEVRTTAAVTDWLAARRPAWREQIQAVAIDMRTSAARTGSRFLQNRKAPTRYIFKNGLG
nr:hypothetical protein [Micromonospora saelicesensis]